VQGFEKIDRRVLDTPSRARSQVFVRAQRTFGFGIIFGARVDEFRRAAIHGQVPRNRLQRLDHLERRRAIADDRDAAAAHIDLARFELQRVRRGAAERRQTGISGIFG